MITWLTAALASSVRQVTNPAAVLALLSMASVVAQQLLRAITGAPPRTVDLDAPRPLPPSADPTTSWAALLSALRERVASDDALRHTGSDESVDDVLQGWISVLDAHLDRLIAQWSALDDKLQTSGEGWLREVATLHAQVVRRLHNGRALLAYGRAPYSYTAVGDEKLIANLLELELSVLASATPAEREDALARRAHGIALAEVAELEVSASQAASAPSGDLTEIAGEVSELVRQGRHMRRTGAPWQEVVGVLEKAVARCQPHVELHRDYTEALLELSTTRRFSGDFRAAEKWALQALENSELNSNRLGIARANYELARIALDDEDAVRPGDVTRLDIAAELYGDLQGSKEAEGKGWVNYGQALRYQEPDLERASQFAETAVDIFRGVEDKYGQAQALDLLGALIGKGRRPDQAVRRFSEARKIAEEAGFRPVLALTALHEGETLRTLKDSSAAREKLQLALHLFEELRNESGARAAAHELGQLGRR